MTRSEFGDFQTPRALADEICRLIALKASPPASVLEPTCGLGSFIQASLQVFPNVERVIGLEINPQYVARLSRDLATNSRVTLETANFFAIDWLVLRSALPEPILILGNPPWVTNSELSSLGSANLPAKSNFQRHTGIDALTGRSNFDISEYMLRRLVDTFVSQDTTIAVLCKTAVARKVVGYAWSADLPIYDVEIRSIDASSYFGASVEACLFFARLGRAGAKVCRAFAGLGDDKPATEIGYADGAIIADLVLFDRWRHLQGASGPQWRSGVKHDAARVMELRQTDSGLRNGFDEQVDIEDTFLYPLLKSSDVANHRIGHSERLVLVPQRYVGDDTTGLRLVAPKTWQYLEEHSAVLDARASSIYRNRPRFSIFGVGPYTFAPWKVAISGLYKRLNFSAVGLRDGKPTLFDDTVYFLPCSSRQEATFVAELLNSEPAIEFLSARIFWDSKRPITIDVLSQLDLAALARTLRREDEYHSYFVSDARLKDSDQARLFA